MCGDQVHVSAKDDIYQRMEDLGLADVISVAKVNDHRPASVSTGALGTGETVQLRPHLSGKVKQIVVHARERWCTKPWTQLTT
jgi:hypothetical protein